MNRKAILRGFFPATAVVALLLGGCSTLDAGGVSKKDPAALHGDYSGKDFSGTESNGNCPVWDETKVAQALSIDAQCQRSLYFKLPPDMQSYIREAGWGAFWTAVGEGLFSLPFPYTKVAQYALGGAGYGAAAYTNNTRIRIDSSAKSFQGYCDVMNTWSAQQDYPGKVLAGFNAILWTGHGDVPAPSVKDNAGLPAATKQYTPPAATTTTDGTQPPPFPMQ